MVEEEAQLILMGAQHFSDLFTDEGNTNIVDQLKVIRLFPTFVQEEERVSFRANITLTEVEDVLKGFKKNKIPGPDVWPVEFFLSFF